MKKRMKRAMCFLSALMLATFGLAGCGNKKIPLLKDVYKDYFPIGAAVSAEALNAYENTLMPHFNSISPENDMKWSNIHPGQDRYTWTKADALVTYARERGMKVHGHTFLWHRSVPAWLIGDNPSKEILTERVVSHIDTVIKHFGKDVALWDVVNEALKQGMTEADVASGNIYRTGADASQNGQNNDWFSIGGVELISDAFKAARKAADEIGAFDMKLYYNDFSMLDPARRQAFIAMYHQLKELDTPIDGIGMQAHYDIKSFNAEEFDASVKAFVELGLDVQVTEADFSTYPWTYSGEVYSEPPEKILHVQAKMFGSIFETMRKYSTPAKAGHGRTAGVTVWTVADDITWLDNDPIPNRKNWPAIFDVDHQPKEAFFEIINFKKGK